MSTNRLSKMSFRLFCALMLVLSMQGCVGTIVGAVTDTTIEVAKLPFKVVGAAVDLALPDHEDD